jgi:hypothetical protein
MQVTYIEKEEKGNQYLRNKSGEGRPPVLRLLPIHLLCFRKPFIDLLLHFNLVLIIANTLNAQYSFGNQSLTVGDFKTDEAANR